ncbi:MAG: cell division protein PerM [Microbacterium sp.]
MHRLIVVILSAVDAAIAAAVGIAATLAPLTLLWVLGMGGAADWGALWPAGATVWQFGNLVPLEITLPGDYLAVAGIDPGAASFALSLAPLAFASFTAIFAARSGVRASQADAWVTGVIAGSLVFAALTALVALSAANALAEVVQWQAILFPALVFSVPLLAGAVVTEWREAGSGVIARVRDRVEAVPHGWGAAPGLVVRGTAVVLAGLIGLGALMFAVSLVLRGGEVIALYEAAQVDALGATVVTLAQLAYLPTLAIWGMAFVAGPGFAVGVDTAVSPAGTQVGVIPGIPVLGAIPESTTPWLLLLALLPVALGAFAGWIARSRLVAPPAMAENTPTYVPIEWEAGPDAARSSALTALLAGVETSAVPRLDDDATGHDSGPGSEDHRVREGDDPIGARAVIAVGIAVLSAGGAALLAVLASGSMGPGRLAEVGPHAGPVALAVGLEVVLGAAILLLSPRRAPKRAAVGATGVSEPTADSAAPVPRETVPPAPVVIPPSAPERAVPASPADTTANTTVAVEPADPDSTATMDLGPRRPLPLAKPLPEPRAKPLPPVD